MEPVCVGMQSKHNQFTKWLNHLLQWWVRNLFFRTAVTYITVTNWNWIRCPMFLREVLAIMRVLCKIRKASCWAISLTLNLYCKDGEDNLGSLELTCLPNFNTPSTQMRAISTSESTFAWGRSKPFYHPTSLTSLTTMVIWVVALSIRHSLLNSLENPSQHRVCLQFKSRKLNRPKLALPRACSL